MFSNACKRRLMFGMAFNSPLRNVFEAHVRWTSLAEPVVVAVAVAGVFLFHFVDLKSNTKVSTRSSRTPLKKKYENLPNITCLK